MMWVWDYWIMFVVDIGYTFGGRKQANSHNISELNILLLNYFSRAVLHEARSCVQRWWLSIFFEILVTVALVLTKKVWFRFSVGAGLSRPGTVTGPLAMALMTLQPNKGKITTKIGHQLYNCHNHPTSLNIVTFCRI